VTTRNVTCLRLSPPVPAQELRRLRITWNGQRVDPAVDADGRIVLGQLPGGGEGLLKTPGLCGPVREVFAGPFLMVYGGREGGPSHNGALAAAAQWRRFSQGQARVLPASGVSEAVLRNHNVILFGGPDENPLVAEVMPQLPIKIRKGFYEVGERRYEADRFGLWMVYPSPWGPGRYMALNCGPPWGRELPPNHVYDMLPDFVVYCDEKSEDGTESNKCVCAGFFDQQWRLDERSTWHSEEPR